MLLIIKPIVMLSKIQIVLLVLTIVYLYQMGVNPTVLGVGSIALILGILVLRSIQSAIHNRVYYGGITLLVSKLTGLPLDLSSLVVALVLVLVVYVFVYAYLKRNHHGTRAW